MFVVSLTEVFSVSVVVRFIFGTAYRNLLASESQLLWQQRLPPTPCDSGMTLVEFPVNGISYVASIQNKPVTIAILRGDRVFRVVCGILQEKSTNHLLNDATVQDIRLK